MALTLAALADTLRQFLMKVETDTIPVWQMISRPVETLEHRVRNWVDSLDSNMADIFPLQGESAIGGGSFPGVTLPSWLLAVECNQPQRLAKCLRAQEPAIVGRIAEGLLLFDARTIDPDDDQQFIDGLRSCLIAMESNEHRESLT